MKKTVISFCMALVLLVTSVTPAHSGIGAAVIMPVLLTIAESVSQMTSLVTTANEQYKFFKEKEDKLLKVNKIFKSFKSFEQMIRLSSQITTCSDNIVRLMKQNADHLTLRDVRYLSNQVTQSLETARDVLTFGKLIFQDDESKMSDSERFAQTQQILKNLNTMLSSLEQTENSVQHLSSIMKARRLL